MNDFGKNKADIAEKLTTSEMVDTENMETSLADKDTSIIGVEELERIPGKMETSLKDKDTGVEASLIGQDTSIIGVDELQKADVGGDSGKLDTSLIGKDTSIIGVEELGKGGGDMGTSLGGDVKHETVGKDSSEIGELKETNTIEDAAQVVGDMEVYMQTSVSDKDMSIINKEEVEKPGNQNNENLNDSFEMIDKKQVEEECKDSDQQKDDDKTDRDDSWMHVLGHDKLKKKVLKAGKGPYGRPVHGQLVTVRCCGTLEDGTRIDEGEINFIVGDGDVIQALDLCLPLMELEEVAVIETDAKYAYGSKGRQPDVGPDASISYEVELLKVEDPPNYGSLPLVDRINVSSAKRERGNWWYSRNDYSSAISSYTKALSILEDAYKKEESQEDMDKFTQEKIKCHNNLGAAQLKVEAWDAARKSCDVVLKHEPTNVKALFRKAKCFSEIGEMESAINVLRKAIKIEPESKLIHNELSRLVNKHKAQTESAKQMYQRMLGTNKQKAKENDSQGSMWKWYALSAGAAAAVSMGIAAYRYMNI